MTKLSNNTVTVTQPSPFVPTLVRASAFGDQIRGGSMPLWRVQAWTQPPHAHRRSYDIEARSEGLAAQEGIKRIVEEVEILNEGG